MKLIQEFDATNIDIDIDKIYRFAHRDYKSQFSSQSYFGIHILEYWTQDFVRNGEDILQFYSANENDVENFLSFQLRILQLSQEDDYRIKDFREFLHGLHTKPISANLFMDKLKLQYSIIKQPDETIIDIEPKDCVMLIEEWNDIFGACKTVNGYFGFNWTTSA